MKQFSLSILLTLFLSMAGINAFAYDIAVENTDGKTIYYNYINNGAELEVTYRTSLFYYEDNKTAYSGNVVIPEKLTYNNIMRKVTRISDRAFSYCSELTSVTIPNSVTTIGLFAFYYCSGLKSVTIGSGLTTMGDRAFMQCTGLEKVIVKDIAAWCKINYEGIYGGSYSNPLYYAHHLYKDENTEIKKLVIPNGVTSIGASSFFYCENLTSVTIPNSVSNIGDGAFYGCGSLTSLTIPNSVITIGGSAFAYCI